MAYTLTSAWNLIWDIKRIVLRININFAVTIKDKLKQKHLKKIKFILL
jgi:hypothetical protein